MTDTDDAKPKPPPPPTPTPPPGSHPVDQAAQEDAAEQRKDGGGYT